MNMRTRKRNVKYGGQLIAYSGGSPPGAAVYAPSYTDIHSCTDEVHKGPPYRDGGPLAVQRTVTRVGITASVLSRRTALPSYYYFGSFYCPVPGNALPLEGSISGLGAEGWSRSIPGSPILSLGVSIGEMKDLPRMLLGAKKFFSNLSHLGLKFSKTPKRVADLKNSGWNPGDDYLNLQFGWVPFVRDLYGALTFQEKLAKKLAALKKGNGRNRRYYRLLRNEHWEKAVNPAQPTFTSLAPVISTFAYPSGAIEPRDVKQIYSKRAWFEAAFTYYIPELDDPSANLTKLKFDLLGLSLDPVVIYNLVPWSWLIDWFTNTGAIVRNAVLMSRYHVVARYAYVMKSEETTFVQSGTHDMFIGTNSSVVGRLSAESSRKRVYRRREVANPYGFGVTDASLSAYQWSILIALGLTRLR
jgi:hypothetical protein